jgi:hypothetical protein
MIERRGFLASLVGMVSAIALRSPSAFRLDDGGIYLYADEKGYGSRVASDVRLLLLDGAKLYDCVEADETFGWAKCLATNDPTNRRQFLNEPAGIHLRPDGTEFATVVHFGKVEIECTPALREWAHAYYGHGWRRMQYQLAQRAVMA